MKFRKIFVSIVLMSAAVAGAFLLNSVIDSRLIPDPCVYHNVGGHTNMIFDLFYEFPPHSGGHPAPTAFNLLFTIIAGAWIGFLLAGLVNHAVDKKFRIIS